MCADDERPWWAGLDEPDATCHNVGLSGNCGDDCPVLHRGDCQHETDMLASELRDESVKAFFGRWSQATEPK